MKLGIFKSKSCSDVQSCFFANQTYCFFDVLVAVPVFIAKAPYFIEVFLFKTAVKRGLIIFIAFFLSTLTVYFYFSNVSDQTPLCMCLPALSNLDPRALRSVSTGFEDITLCALSEQHTTKRKFVSRYAKDQGF